MDNSINHINFRANVKTLINVKNRAKFDRVLEKFKKGTEKYPNATLYITRTRKGAYSWHTSDCKCGDFYTGPELFTNSIDEHLDQLTETQFAKELINTFNIMKLQEIILPKARQLNAEIERVKNVLISNNNLAKACIKNGKKDKAHAYTVLAKQNFGRIQTLQQELDKNENLFKNTKSRYSKEFPEIDQIDLYTV